MDIVLLLIIGIVAIPFLAKMLARDDQTFTEGKTNYIKYAERAGVFDHMIPEVPGYILDNPNSRDAEFRKAGAGETQALSPLNTTLHGLLGIYFYGIYPFKKIARLKIKKTYDNIEGTGPKDWIRPGEEADEPGIRHTFPRAFVFTDVELPDRTKVNVKMLLKLRVVKPYIPKYEFGNDFFTPIGSLVQSEVIDNLIDLTVDDGSGGKRKLNIDDFINHKKGETAGFLKVHKEPLSDGKPSLFNQVLINQVGICIDGININDWNPGDTETVEAIRQKALEKLQGEARITKAEKDAQVTEIAANAYKKRIGIETEADVARQNALTDARGKRIRETVATLASSLGSPDVVARGAADVLEAEAHTSETSKLTTVIKGDSSRVVYPVGGDKK